MHFISYTLVEKRQKQNINDVQIQNLPVCKTKNMTIILTACKFGIYGTVAVKI